MSGCGGKNFVERLARSERPCGAREGTCRERREIAPEPARYGNTA